MKKVNKDSAFNRFCDEAQDFIGWGTILSRELYPTAEEARAVFASWLERIGGNTSIGLPLPSFIRYGYPPSEIGDAADFEYRESAWYGPVKDMPGAKPVWLWEGDQAYRKPGVSC